MYKNLFVLLALAAVLTVGSCRVVRDAPNTANSFSDFFSNAEKGFKEFQDFVMQSLGVKDAGELEQKAKKTGEDIASQLDVWANDIKKSTEELKDNPAVKGLRETVDKAIDEFKLKHPETAEDIRTYMDKAHKESEAVIEKIKKLGDSEEAKNIKDLSQKLLSQTAETFQNITKNVTEDLKKQ